MKKLTILIFIALFFTMCSKTEFYSGITGFQQIMRLEIEKEHLPEGFTFVEDIGKGFQVWKYKTNFFLIQRIKSYRVSYYDFTKIDW